MMGVFVFLLAVISAYLIGAIPTGFLMTKIFAGVDIRKTGSKNVGATNVYRVAGKLPGLATLLIDMGKGVLAVTLVAWFYHSFIREIDYGFFQTILGIIAIFGHIWSVFLKFKGGKGVATTIGVTAVIAPLALIISLGIWLAAFIPTNYVSLGSLAFGMSLPICAIILNQPFYVVLFCVIICLLNTYKHKENIKRLIKGEENKTIIFRNK